MIDFVNENLLWENVVLARNDVQHIIQAADPDTYEDRSGLKYFLEIYLPEYPFSNNYERLIRLEGRERPGRLVGGAMVYEGSAFRKLEKLLAGFLTLTKPAYQQKDIRAISSLTTPYRLREMIEPEILDRQLPVQYAIRAGLALRDFSAYSHQFFSRHQAEKMQFLTWHPDNKQVCPCQEEYLYFLLNMSPLPAEVNLRIRVTKTDGSRSVSTARTVSNLARFQVISVPVGPQALELPADVVKYEVWLSDEDDQRFSEVRTYHIDRRKHRFERYLIFSNSLGGFDTLRLLGRAYEESDVYANTARRERDPDKGIDFLDLEVISTGEESGISISTGIFEQDDTVYLDYLRELMMAEQVFMVTDYGHESMNLINSNIRYREDDPGLIERTFQLKRTYSDPNYSRLPATEPIPARPTTWQGLGMRPVLDSNGKRTGLLVFERMVLVYEDDNSQVVPYTVKPNLPGDPDYKGPIPGGGEAGTTPYPSLAISRPGTFRRNNCPAEHTGGPATIAVPAGMFGGEAPGDADLLAEAHYRSLDTQAYANLHGTCTIIAPVHLAIHHKIHMIGIKVAANDYYDGPFVSVIVNGDTMVPSTSGANPAVVVTSAETLTTGTYTIVVQVNYVSASLAYPCRLRLLGKNRQLNVSGPGFFAFENVVLTAADDPLTVEVTAL